MGRNVVVMPNAERLQFLILGSMTLGPEAMTRQGFEWVQRFDRVTLASKVANIERREAMWGDRIRKWQREGLMGDRPLNFSPGVLVWFISVERAAIGDRRISNVLWVVAEELASQTPHARFEFDHGPVNTLAIATTLVRIVETVAPFSYRG